MTANDDLDRVIAGWLETEAQSHVRADGLERVLDITRRRRPRASWLAAPGSRRVGGPRVTDRTVPAPRLRGLHLRWSMVAVLLLALAILGGAILAVGSIPPRPGPLGETGRLAYVLDGVLFLADWDGRNAVRVDGASMSGGSCEAIFMEGRMWSPDGRHLAYRTGFPTGCTPTVHIVDAQGRAVSSWSGMDGRKVEWAPDSERVVTWGLTDDTFDIRGVDGGLQQQLHMPEGACVCGDRDPTWNYDGTAILIRMVVAPEEMPTHLWQLSIADGVARPLTDAFVRSFAYSPDGSRIAYFAIGTGDEGPNPDSRGSLVITSTDYSAVRRVVIGKDYGDFIWSPASDRIAASTDTSPGTHDLQLVNAATGQLTTVSTVRGDAIRPLAFSHDGHRILFTRSESLWTVNTDGSGAHVLVVGADWGDWQPLPR